MPEYETKDQLVHEFGRLDRDAAVELEDVQRVEIFEVVLFGRELTVSVTDSEVDEGVGYRFRIDAIDKATGEPVGRGNGGRTLDDAISAFHWQSLESHIRALPEN